MTGFARLWKNSREPKVLHTVTGPSVASPGNIRFENHVCMTRRRVFPLVRSKDPAYELVIRYRVVESRRADH